MPRRYARDHDTATRQPYFSVFERKIASTLKRKLTLRSTRTPTKASKTYQQKPVILVALLVGSIFGYEVASYRYAEQAALTSSNAVMQVRFSPGGHCTQFVKEAISRAQKTILVQAYAFTSLPIAEALL